MGQNGELEPGAISAVVIGGNHVEGKFALEFRESLFLRATASGENIRRIYVAGGTARVPGLLDLLKEEFAMPVEELYPFRKIALNPERHDEAQLQELAPRLAIATGLALRSFDTP